MEAVGALNVTAPAAQRNVESGADGQQHHQNRSGQIEVVGDLSLKHEQGERDRNARGPGAALEAAIDRAFSFQRTLLRHHLGANDLKRKRDRRDQRQQGVNRGGMAEAGGPKEARHRNVVG